MCDPRLDSPGLTHWAGARALAERLGRSTSGAEQALGRIVDHASEELHRGHRPTVALARALSTHIQVVAHDRCVNADLLVPHRVVAIGTGHEFACALVALEAAARLGIDAQIACTSELALLVVEDEPGSWSALVPDFEGIQWVPMPARVLLDQSARAMCAHDATRTSVRLMSELLPTESLDDAMHLLDELTVA